MKSEEWPIAAPAADPPVDAPRLARPDRLATVRRDFFLDPAARLTEQERALMTSMLDDVVETIADELLAGLPEPLQHTDHEGHERLSERLKASGLLDRPVLIAMLLRVADQHRLAEAVQSQSRTTALPLLQRWVADPDGDIAEGAMALVIARGRRRDRFGRPRVLFDDLPGEEAVTLVYLVAAALRSCLPDQPASDQSMAGAAKQLLARHDEGLRMEAQNGGLVRLLERAGRLDDALVDQAVVEGEVALLSAMLARRASVPENIAWDHIVAAGQGRLMTLARLAGVERTTAARMLVAVGGLAGVTDPTAELSGFDAFGAPAVEDIRGEWQLSSIYCSARDALRG